MPSEHTLISTHSSNALAAAIVTMREVIEKHAGGVSGGRQLADPVRGAPDARILTAAVRYTWATDREPDDEGASAYVRMVPAEGGATLYIHVAAPEGALDLSWHNPQLIATLAAIGIAATARQPLLTIIGGLGVFFVWRFVALG